MAVNLITKTAYARHRGCDEKAVRKAVAEGRISLIDGKIDPAVADIQWAANTRARADSRPGAASNGAGQGLGLGEGDKTAPAPDFRPAGGAGAGGSAGRPDAEPGYHDHRARRERADAEKAEIEVGQLADRLVQRATTERAIFDAFRALRDAAFAAPTRAAPKVLGMAEIRDIEYAITEELRKAFDGWEATMLECLAQKDRT